VTAPSQQLRDEQAALWPALTGHPFVVATGDGTLPGEAFDRWLVADHLFVVGFRRFLGRLLELAPDEAARDVVAGGIAALTPELALFRDEAARRGLALDAEAGPVVLGYTAFVQASTADGWASGLTVLYGAERAYFDAWSAVRLTAGNHTPYARFVQNWSSPAFGAYVDALAGLVDALEGPTARQLRLFGQVVRFERRFWDAVADGDPWN